MIFSSQVLGTQEEVSKRFENNNISENNIININKISYLLECIPLLEDENKKFEENINLINEGILAFAAINTGKRKLSLLDPISIIEKIIDAFINILLRIWREFEALCMKLLGKSTNIHKFKNKLLNMPIDVKFNDMYYNYTNTGRDSSGTSFKIEMKSVSDTLYQELSKIRDLRQNSALMDKLKEIEQDSIVDDLYYDNIRGKIVGDSNSISSVDYQKYLYNFFRDGGQMIQSGSISAREIQKRAQQWFNFQSTFRSIKKDKIDMESYANDLRKELQRVSINDYINKDLDVDISAQISTISINYATRIKELCNIYVIWFASKMDAAKEEYSTNSKILYKAAETLVRQGL